MILAATATVASLAAAFKCSLFLQPWSEGVAFYGFINGIFNVVKTEPRVGGDGGD